MIYFNGIESVIECTYLGEELCLVESGSNIIVNPLKLKYLTGKTIIINSTTYPEDNLKCLIDNECKIISRVFLQTNLPIIYSPYILRIDYNIMWNGDYIDKLPDLTKYSVLESGDICRLKLPDYKLFFPKVKKYSMEECIDSKGNLTAIGWAYQQVGINITNNIKDLDVLKTGKILL